MAIGINSRDGDLVALLQSILRRIYKLERPVSIHIGGINGYTLSVNAAGQLISTSANGTVTVVNPGP